MIFRNCEYFGSFYRHESKAVCVDALHDLFDIRGGHCPIDIQITRRPVCKESVKISFEQVTDEDNEDYEYEYCTTWYATSDRFTGLTMTHGSSKFLTGFFKDATKGVLYVTVWEN